jgi:hypothetical protein
VASIFFFDSVRTEVISIAGFFENGEINIAKSPKTHNTKINRPIRSNTITAIIISGAIIARKNNKTNKITMDTVVIFSTVFTKRLVE